MSYLGRPSAGDSPFAIGDKAMKDHSNPQPPSQRNPTPRQQPPGPGNMMAPPSPYGSVSDEARRRYEERYAKKKQEEEAKAERERLEELHKAGGGMQPPQVNVGGSGYGNGPNQGAQQGYGGQQQQGSRPPPPPQQHPQHLQPGPQRQFSPQPNQQQYSPQPNQQHFSPQPNQHPQQQQQYNPNPNPPPPQSQPPPRPLPPQQRPSGYTSPPPQQGSFHPQQQPQQQHQQQPTQRYSQDNARSPQIQMQNLSLSDNGHGHGQNQGQRQRFSQDGGRSPVPGQGQGSGPQWSSHSPAPPNQQLNHQQQYQQQSQQNQHPQQSQHNHQQPQQQQQQHQQPSQEQQQPAPPQRRQSDPNDLQALFTQFDSSRTGQLNSYDLQRLLAKDATMEAREDCVKMLMNIFDTDRSGSINFMEFEGLYRYIKDWHNIFLRFDRDSSGLIDRKELHQALLGFGFSLPPEMVKRLEKRFAPPPKPGVVAPRGGGISFDRFLMACVTVKHYTEGFRRADTTGSGRLTLDYNQFMEMILDAP